MPVLLINKIVPQPDVVAPTAPAITATGVTSTTASVALTSAAVDAGSGVASYELQYKAASSGTYLTDSAALPASQFPRTISGLTQLTSYNFRARATDFAGNVGPYSAVSTASTPDTTAPVSPSVVASTLSMTSISVALTVQSTDVGGSGVSTYELQYKRTVDPTWTVDSALLTTSSFPRVIAGLISGTSYDVWCRSRDVAGNISVFSAVSSTTTTASDTTAPTAPVITASASGQTTISVALTTPSTDVGGSGVSTYRLEYKTSASPTWLVDSSTLTGASFPRTISGLVAGTGYDTRCRATDVAGNVGPYSGTSQVTTNSSGTSLTLTTSWQSIAISTATQLLTFSFTATPGEAATNTVIGFSAGVPAQFDDQAVQIRFSTANVIEARNGGGYSAVTSRSYTPGVAYAFSGTIDIAAGTFSVSVTPAGGSAAVIATNYAFRTPQSGVTTSIARLGGIVGLTVNMPITNVVATPSNYPAVVAPTIAVGTVTNTSIAVTISGTQYATSLVPQLNSGSGFVDLAAIAASSTTYVFSGLSASTSYTMRIRAANASSSANSNSVTQTTNATATASSFPLSYNDPNFFYGMSASGGFDVPNNGTVSFKTISITNDPEDGAAIWFLGDGTGVVTNCRFKGVEAVRVGQDPVSTFYRGSKTVQNCWLEVGEGIQNPLSHADGIQLYANGSPNAVGTVFTVKNTTLAGGTTPGLSSAYNLLYFAADDYRGNHHIENVLFRHAPGFTWPNYAMGLYGQSTRVELYMKNVFFAMSPGSIDRLGSYPTSPNLGVNIIHWENVWRVTLAPDGSIASYDQQLQIGDMDWPGLA